MMKLLVLHLLLLLLLPIIWHVLKKESEESATYAAAQASSGVLSDTEQDYYNMVFSYAMQNLADGKSYSWQENKSSGSITVGATFVSASRSFCRRYAETTIINGVRGAAKGIACRRENDDNPPTWCKLREGDALTCALEHTRGPMDSLGNNVEDALHKIFPNMGSLR